MLQLKLDAPGDVDGASCVNGFEGDKRAFVQPYPREPLFLVRAKTQAGVAVWLQTYNLNLCLNNIKN